eukprot:6194029-Pleurochrysis_carterae.AAC.3
MEAQKKASKVLECGRTACTGQLRKRGWPGLKQMVRRQQNRIMKPRVHRCTGMLTCDTHSLQVQVAVPGAEWSALSGRVVATDSELLVMAMLMLYKFNGHAVASWGQRSLVQEDRYTELGDMWVPPISMEAGGADWNGKGSLLSEDSGLCGALT